MSGRGERNQFTLKSPVRVPEFKNEVEAQEFYIKLKEAGIIMQCDFCEAEAFELPVG